MSTLKYLSGTSKNPFDGDGTVSDRKQSDASVSSNFSSGNDNISSLENVATKSGIITAGARRISLHEEHASSSSSSSRPESRAAVVSGPHSVSRYHSSGIDHESNSGEQH